MSEAGGPWARRFLLVLILSPLTACLSSDQKGAVAAQRVHSWAASVDLSVEAVARQAVPLLYARQVLQAATEAREQESTTPEWETIPLHIRHHLDEAIRRLAGSLREPSGTQR
jgi:hypothetical protein